MNRRELVFTAIAATTSAYTLLPDVAVAAISAGTFLRGVYEREIAHHNRRLPADHDGFHSMFTRQMRELMNAPRMPNPNIPIGPIRHAMFGDGALPGREVTLADVTTIRENTGSATVKVALDVIGHPRTVVVSMLREDGAWRIKDVEYDGGDTLSAHYKRMAGR